MILITKQNKNPKPKLNVPEKVASAGVQKQIVLAVEETRAASRDLTVSTVLTHIRSIRLKKQETQMMQREEKVSADPTLTEKKRQKTYILFHQLVTHTHIAEVGRRDNQRVFLLQSQQRRQNTVLEILEARVFLRLKAFHPGHQLEDLFHFVYHMNELTFAPVFLHSNRARRALCMLAEEHLQLGLVEMRGHQQLAVLGRLALEEILPHTREIRVVRRRGELVGVLHDEIQVVPVLHVHHIGLVEHHNLHGGQKVRRQVIVLALVRVVLHFVACLGGIAHGQTQAQR